MTRIASTAALMPSWGGSEAIAMRALLAILGLWTISARADELPNDLLLKCEGKVSIVFTVTGRPPNLDDFNEDKFDVMLHLKDGKLSDPSMWLAARGCTLRNGLVHCSATSIVPSNIDSGSTRWELNSYVTRQTGEYNLFVETWSFEGRNASGRPTGNMKLRRNGVCRQVSKPIF
jgi:hypothetical protein